MKKSILAPFAILSLAVVLSGCSFASTIDFKYSGTGAQVSGQFIGTETGTNVWTITDVRGTYNGEQITGAVPLNRDSNFLYNNLLYASNPVVDWYGILFNVQNEGHVNLYFDGQNYINASNFGGGFQFTDVNVADNAATPEPGTLVMLGTGMLGMAGLIRRKLGL